jgi:hypothetical protein
LDLDEVEETLVKYKESSMWRGVNMSVIIDNSITIYEALNNKRWEICYACIPETVVWSMDR